MMFDEEKTPTGGSAKDFSLPPEVYEDPMMNNLKRILSTTHNALRDDLVSRLGKVETRITIRVVVALSVLALAMATAGWYAWSTLTKRIDRLEKDTYHAQ